MVEGLIEIKGSDNNTYKIYKKGSYFGENEYFSNTEREHDAIGLTDGTI